MNAAAFALNKRVITYLFVLLVAFGGVVAYQNLGRLEDPEFTIRDAHVLVAYPGATAQEVEEEVTDVIENAVQQLSAIDELKSESRPGLSRVIVTIQDQYRGEDLKMVWQQMRAKVDDALGDLPPGTSAPVVLDDYGDVFGVYWALHGDGYTMAELNAYAKELRTDVLTVEGVARVTIDSVVPETIYVEFGREKIADLGLSRDSLVTTLQSHNMVVDAGSARVGDERIRLRPTGKSKAVEELADLIIQDGSAEGQLRLGDIAKVTRAYQDPPNKLATIDGVPMIAIGVSAAPGSNVVDMGAGIDLVLERVLDERPIGMELTPIYMQHEYVTESVSAFVWNLVAAVAIVIVVLLFFMGARSGFLIGGVLALTVAMTLIMMWIDAIPLQRISLGALIIALGMLVDNAIVVVEGILVKTQKGEDPAQAGIDIVAQTTMPLLGATVVAILAFAGIGLSPDSTGEYVGTLFWVICYSLFASWVLAITVTPVACTFLFKAAPTGDGAEEGPDPYDNVVFRTYRRFLEFCVRRRWATVGALLVMLGTSVVGFGWVPSAFFPNGSTPIFVVDYWRAEGSDIEATHADVLEISEWLREQEGVTQVSSFTGAGSMRFMLTFSPKNDSPSYANLLIKVDDFTKIDGLMDKVNSEFPGMFPDSEWLAWKLKLGPGGEAAIQARFSGPDPAVLRDLSAQAQEALRSDPNTKAVKDDWRNRVKVSRPVYSDARGRETGVTRESVAGALQYNYIGQTAGFYREGEDLIPMVVRAPLHERADISGIVDLQAFSPVAQGNLPLSQVLSGVQVEWEDTNIHRREKMRTITPQADQRIGLASPVFERVRPQVEAIELPPGYFMEWGGEYEDSKEANENVAAQLPMAFGAMVVIVIMLFNAVRQPLIIWLTVPLALIGVTFGLLITQVAFGFMAMLGFLSLVGMLIKNAIVLIDEIDTQIGTGKDQYLSVIDSAVSRVRPVSMAAITTILGMVPLVADPFFVDMSVTIMFGLGFATVLTLVVVPVLYAIFFKIESPA